MIGSATLSDGELFQQVQSGDKSAFAALVDRHKDGLVNYLTRLCGDSTRAEDLAQEAFLRLYERADSYLEQGKLQAYLYRIGTNLLRSQIRREQRWRRIRTVFSNTNGHHAEPQQQARLLRQEIGEQLTICLQRIPLHYRTPLVLAFVEGWTHQQIAKLMGCKEGTVKSRIHRARKLLQSELAQYRHGGIS